MSIVIIDSWKLNAICKTSTNFKYVLSKSIKCKKMKLLYAAIPYSWYMIDDLNNHLKIKFNDTSTYDIYLSSGNYDVVW